MVGGCVGLCDSWSLWADVGLFYRSAAHSWLRSSVQLRRAESGVDPLPGETHQIVR